MPKGYGGPIRRRKGLLRVAPLARSHSLGAISTSLLRSSLQPRSANNGSSAGINNPYFAGDFVGPQHLPPLGSKDRQPRVVASSLPPPQQQQQYHQHHQHLHNRPDSDKTDRNALVRSSSSAPASTPTDSSFTGPVQAPYWTAFADVFLQAGQAAGIAFRWTETETETAASPRGTPASIAGLSVVGVADGSLAARHGGISPGMMLVEINRERVSGMGQDKMMRLMHIVASQSRVLTLARIATPPPPFPPATGASSSNTKVRLQEGTSEPLEFKPLVPGYSSAVSTSSAEDARRPAARTTPTNLRALSSMSSQATSPPHSSISSSSDNDDRDASSGATCGSALFSPLHASNVATPASADSSKLSSTRNINHHHRVSSSLSPLRLIALRFVGSRGDMALFDRDHVLGFKKRDIEFAPPNNDDRGGSQPSMTAAQHHRLNSRRSLQEMTLDWRNDPFSTPARRRRLINDACKVIVWSYAHASVLRVAQLRREERYITRIQATYRMALARRLFCAQLAARRIQAASVLQLGWLTCAARSRVAVLREERNQNRIAEEGRRRRREAQKYNERCRREEDEREREREETEKETRRRELVLAVFVQRRFRAKQKKRRRLTQLKRLQDEQQREAANLLQAVRVVQAVFRRLQHYRRRHEEQASHRRRAHHRVTIEGVASVRLQRVWRRCKATKMLDTRRQRDPGTSTCPSPIIDGKAVEEQTAQLSSTLLHSDEGHFEPKNGASNSPKRNLGQSPYPEMSVGTKKGSSSWANWPSAFGANSSLAAEIAREGETDNVAGNSRPWTAAGSKAHPAKPRSSRLHRPKPSPAGMMTVKVRRGLEETSLVTPIVLTESGDEEQDASIAPSYEAGGASATVDMTMLAYSSCPGNAESEISRPQFVPPLGKAVRMIEAQGAALSSQADEPKTRRQQLEINTFCTTPTSAITTPINPASNQGAGDETVARNISPLPHIMAVAVVNEDATGVTAAATTALMPKVAGSGGDPPVVVSTPITESGEEFARAVIKPTEQLYMEDTQVYLGCTVCGVKYLVEAVDPGVSESTQGQPAPEVLYLCTTCGRTLRNNGEDGRWKRRRRPSSAPAAGRRDRSAAFFGGDGGARTSNINGRAPGETLDGDGQITIDESQSAVETSQQALLVGVGREGRRGGDDSAARLRYAHCARAIQHAYQNFLHRQYLRDWAFSLLRRWLVHRVQSRKKAKLRLRCRRAAVTLQSAVRAASARRRCSTLRAARLRFWMERVAALYDDDGDKHSPSPIAAELLREIETPRQPFAPQWSSVLSPPLPPRSRAAAKAGGKGIANSRSRSRGRALAEALAPRMGRPPPGCPAALDVDWGEWGFGLSLVFPPSPCVG